MIGHVFTSREGKINTKTEAQVNFILKKRVLLNIIQRLNNEWKENTVYY